MDANAPRRGGSRRFRGGALVVAGVVGLVAVVAVASSGSAPDGGIAERRPSEGFADALLSVFLVLMAFGAVAVVVMLSFFGRYLPEGELRDRKRRGAVRSIVSFVLAMALVAIIVRALNGSGGNRSGVIPSLGRADGDANGDPAGGYRPEFAVWPAAAFLTLVAVALGAWWLSARGRRATRDVEVTPEEALSEVLAATLDDLRAEADPRRAVIAAYARMERSLAAVGLRRGPAEAPEEYLARVLEDIAVSERSAGRLTALFAWARFSGHDVGPEMKDEAIATLEQVQQELEWAETARRGALADAV